MVKKRTLHKFAIMNGLLIVTLIGLLGRQISGEVSEETQNAASNANVEFSFDLLRQLSESGKNVFFSPYSIAAAVAMTSLGASGNTLNEIDRTFHFDEVKNTSTDAKALHEVFKKSLMLYGQSNSNYSLSAANRLFAQQGFEIKQQFKDDTRDYYMAEIEQVVFGNGEAENIINRWVEQQTHDKIKELFKPNSLDSNTVLALVSAIYFKGNWQTQFNKEATTEMDFHPTASENTKVKMMSVTNNFNYHEEGDVKILELPYSGNDISMVIVLPQQGELQQVISQLNASTLENWLQKLRSRKVNVKIPKFKLETEYSLKEALGQLGIKDLFTNRCNLSEIISLGDVLSISEVQHKAFVQIDEEGTEAAAATGMIPYPRSRRGRNIRNFTADHPFLFLIRHKYEYNDHVLFIGVLSAPDEETSAEL